MILDISTRKFQPLNGQYQHDNINISGQKLRDELSGEDLADDLNMMATHASDRT